MNKQRILLLFLRYFFLISLSFGNLAFFYFLFSAPTHFFFVSLSKLFFDVQIQEGCFLINSVPITVIDACVSGSAYYLLFILNFTTPLKIRKRILVLLFTIFVFFIFNISRMIFLLAILNYEIFNLTHNLLWHFGSTIFIVLLWFLSIKIFSIKEIPVYSDMVYLYSLIKLEKEQQ